MGRNARRRRQVTLAVSELAGGREFDLIRAFLANARKHSHPLVRVGPGDDCAIIGNLAISTDLSVEDVHFRRDWLAPREIGYRSAIAALSDLAAVAATPVAALVSIALREADLEEWAEAVMQGATQAIEACDAMLACGDVTRAVAGAAIDVVAIGTADRPVLRSAAQIGDEVWVTGTLGGAGAAVSAWLAGRTPGTAARERYAHPAARIAEALWLREHVHAMIDLSDGIAGDAGHIAAASGCRLIIDAELLPVNVDADIRLALQGGEDYELCVTAPPGRLEQVRAEFERRFEIRLTRVGVVVAGTGVEVRSVDVQGGFDHYTPRR